MAQNQTKDIILIEPYAGIVDGHMVEKLSLWARGMRENGYSPKVCSFDQLTVVIDGVEDVYVVPILARAIRWILWKQRYRYLWMNFCSYLQAFRLSRRLNCPVIGLSAASPWVVDWAAKVTKPQQPWVFIVMDGGLIKTSEGIEIRPRILKAFRSLLSTGCRLLCNTEIVADTLLRAIPAERKQVSFLPDPTYLAPGEVPGPEGKLGATLLVSGKEDWRRTPIKHLQRAQLKTPIESLTIHRAVFAGTPQFPEFVRRVEIKNDYYTVEQFFQLFVAHKYALFAYDPAFFSASGNLALAIVSGTPVLTSDFSFSRQLKERYGLIGEIFEYGNVKDFEDKWECLAAWGKEEWQQFAAARKRLAADCGYQTVVKKALAFLFANGGETVKEEGL